MLLRFDLEAAALTTTGSETRLVAAGRFNAAAGFLQTVFRTVLAFEGLAFAPGLLFINLAKSMAWCKKTRSSNLRTEKCYTKQKM